MAMRTRDAIWLGLVVGALAACPASVDVEAPPSSAPISAASSPASSPDPATSSAPASAAEPTEPVAQRERWGRCTLAPGPRCRAQGLPWLQSSALDGASLATLASWKPEEGIAGVRVEGGRRVVVRDCRLPGEYVEVRHGVSVRPPDPLGPGAQTSTGASTRGAPEPSPSHEDVEAAKRAYIQGQQAFDAGRYREAFMAFEAAYAHAPKYQIALNAAHAMALAAAMGESFPTGAFERALRRVDEVLESREADDQARAFATQVRSELEPFARRTRSAQPSRDPASITSTWEGTYYRGRVEGEGAPPRGCEAATHALVAFARWRGPGPGQAPGVGVTGILVPLASLAQHQGKVDALDGCFGGVLYESCDAPVLR
ncbi:MAG: hypothetical protein H6713_01815 [Myxococcales bacterium]|nr:hypothetical protein [Myxococcales bacterium]